MSKGAFSADWLALREPADAAARNAGLIDRLGGWMIETGARHVLDLGCGSGATLRALAPHQPDGTVWTLVDHDPALLAAARARLLDWADAAAEDGDTLALIKGAKRIGVRLERHDLATSDFGALLEKTEVELVTASAFFDLAGVDFIEAFASTARDAGAAIYAALTYDGRETWRPAHPAEEDALAAFHGHMRTDKGLGPAAGPEAADVLEQSLRRTGYDVDRAQSDWRLSSPADGPLIRELAFGSVIAVNEALGAPNWLDDWADARSHATSVTVGHADILALPPA